MININVQEPYFSYLMSGQKTIEGRLNKGKFLTIKSGDIVTINDIAEFIVIKKNVYKTFFDMIKVEGIQNVIPNKKTIEEAENIYYGFYTKEDEAQYGVAAIKLKRL